MNNQNIVAAQEETLPPPIVKGLIEGDEHEARVEEQYLLTKPISPDIKQEMKESVAPVQQELDLSPSETVKEAFEELEIDQIQPLETIQDHVTPTELHYPVVAKTPQGCFSLDGQDLIQQAINEQRKTINCFVEYLANHSDVELAIRKAAIRVKPKAGIASCGEIVRNMKCLEEILRDSDEDLGSFMPRGNRRDKPITSTKPENITKLLALRLGKSESAIEKFSSYARFLNTKALNFLAKNKASKDFFEKIRPNRNWSVTMLKSEKKSDDEITLQISKLMLVWYKEFSKNGTVKPTYKDTETATTSSATTDQEKETPKELVSEVMDVGKSVDVDYDTAPAPASKPQPRNDDESQNIQFPQTVAAPEEVSAHLMPMIADQEPEASEETDSLDALKDDVESLIITPLRTASEVLDSNLYHKRLLAVAMNLASLVRRAQGLLNA